MKNRLLPIVRIVTILIVSFVFGIAGNGVAGSTKIVLKMASEYPDKHPTAKNAFMPWIKEVATKSEGRLRILFFNPNALVPIEEDYSSLVAGAVDIIAAPNMNARGQFPLSTGIQIPMMFNGAEGGSLTTWDMYQKYPEWRQEYKDIKVLWQWTSAVYQLHTTKKAVKTLGDLEGMRIIGWSPKVIEIIKKLGAHPVEMTPPDTYLALERGMADGVFCPLAPMKSFKITDAAKYHTVVDLLVDPFYAAMNKDKWNSLPDDLKQVLLDTTGEKMSRKCGLTLDEGSIADAEWMTKRGHEFYVLPESEKLKWIEKLKTIPDGWVKELEGKGVQNAAMILEDIRVVGKEYSETTQGGYLQ